MSIILKWAYSILLLFSFQILLAQSQKTVFNRPKMGSPFIITVYTDDSVKLMPIIEKAYQRVDAINRIFSDYDSTSEISRLCREKAVYTEGVQNVSAELFQVLKMSLSASKMSDGAFDITVGRIVKLWRQARKKKELPDARALKLALQNTGWRKIGLDEKTRKVRFHTEGVSNAKPGGLELDFGGIAKGYAAQVAVNFLTENGYPICLADAGGDMVLGNTPPQYPAWKIGISLPKSDKLMPQLLHLKNQSVATSGDLYQSVDIGSKTYSHIVNPKTGMGLTHQRQVTVIATDGATADWLATACSVLPIRKAMRLIEKMPDAALLILEKRKGKIKSWQSSQFAKYFSEN